MYRIMVGLKYVNLLVICDYIRSFPANKNVLINNLITINVLYFSTKMIQKVFLSN